MTTTQAAVDRLVEACRPKLTPDEWTLVQSHRDLLIDRQLQSEDILRMWSADKLVEAGFTYGAAATLKKAFPTLGAATAQGWSSLLTIKQRLPCTTKYAAYADNNGIKEAAVVVDRHHVATYHHHRHANWVLGQEIEVFVHDAIADHPRCLKAQVDYVDRRTDFILLKVHECLQAPVVDAQLSSGQEYFVLGQSAQAQGDASSVSHGIIAATQPDQQAHIRGDIMSGQGDSGAGCFAVETGRLIGMVVGVDQVAHKAVLVPGAVIAHALSQVSGPISG